MAHFARVSLYLSTQPKLDELQALETYSQETPLKTEDASGDVY
jgi:hypothetical protein